MAEPLSQLFWFATATKLAALVLGAFNHCRDCDNGPRFRSNHILHLYCERLSHKPACLVFAGEFGADAYALVLVMPAIRASFPTT